MGRDWQGRLAAGIRRRITKRRLRLACLCTLVVLLFPVAYNGLVTASPGEFTTINDTDAVNASSSLTVTTTHTGYGTGETGALAVFDENGTRVYQNTTYDRYYDVDPVSTGKYDIIYVAQTDRQPAACGLQTGALQNCVTQHIKHTNLSTDETRTVYETTIFVTGGSDSWHDVDRLDDDRYLVADLFEDRVFIINTSTGVKEFEWAVDEDYPLTSGGRNKADWAHVNDADMVRNGTVMASLRNQDQVVFIDTDTGLQENLTLGTDGDYGTLYEQHNPDYIPRDRGGPAVLVADSQNNRVIEYQRNATTDSWEQSWVYERNLAWPRDADRLPSGNTLITDTHNNRLIEINQSGDIVWKADFLFPYDAERLETGKGSQGGKAASALNLTSETETATASDGGGGSALSHLNNWFNRHVPAKLQHGVLWVAPPWMTLLDVILVGCVAGLTLAWFIAECRWASWIALQWPVSISPNRLTRAIQQWARPVTTRIGRTDDDPPPEGADE